MADSTSNHCSPSDSWAVFDRGMGQETAKLLRLSRHVAVFEIYDPALVVRLSEVLSGFQIVTGGRTLYSGRAVVRHLINTGLAFVCEASLDDNWLDLAPEVRPAVPRPLTGQFAEFLNNWRRFYRIDPQFKGVVTDLHSLLWDLRLWLDQVELEIRSQPLEIQPELETQTLREIGEPVVRAINHLHERFETVAGQIDPEVRPVHQHFTRRHLHPLFLCSPFGHRAFSKPMGYAGDYEMVNMILRSPYEGCTLYAQAINLWLLSQYPSVAHRNRIDYLKEGLVQETIRVQALNRKARILSIGCGPASEVQRFMAATPLSDQAEFLLLDMNDETLDHVRTVLEAQRTQFARRTSFQFVKKSVLQLVRDAARTARREERPGCDFIYCAGLFDYLADRVGRQLMGMFYESLEPGGLLVVTNVVDCRPFRHMLEFILDWHLNYRDQNDIAALVPESIPVDAWAIRSENTGVNLFLEIRKRRLN